MSHGNINNPNNWLDKLNYYLARLMGKKKYPNHNYNNIPSDRKFAIIVVVIMLVLWLLTGIYYVPTDNYGLILKNGKVIKVIHGLEIGVTLPYPLEDVVFLDSSSNTISLIGPKNNLYKFFTLDKDILTINTEISYRITAPKKFFINCYQENDDLNQRIRALAMTIIQDYTLRHTGKFLLTNSTIVTANEIRKSGNKILTNYGIEFDKLNIISIQGINSTKSLDIEQNHNFESTSLSQTMSQAILDQAHEYQTIQNIKTLAIERQFNKDLTEYYKSKDAMVELMYYKMLSSIPNVESSLLKYPLLKLDLLEFKALAGNPDVIKNNASNGRTFSRNVTRERIFKDH